MQFSRTGGASWTTFMRPTSTETTALVTGLTNGADSVFRVAAVNAAGTGSCSALSTRVTPTAGALTTIDLAPFANQRLQSLRSGAVSRFPEGNVKLGGVNFAIPVGGSNAWSAAIGGDTTAGTLDVPIGANGVRKVYTLINTLWGERELGTRASITFHGSKGAVYKVDLMATATSATTSGTRRPTPSTAPPRPTSSRPAAGREKGRRARFGSTCRP
ncbi:MAG: fibronectin type III domain-containing protein, partial [Planctomycetes bacterium]|nr:fibronectin type III domain-containing protein [Planctomycetota bacterium]